MKELMVTANEALARYRYAETETFEAEHSDVANVRATSSSSSANATAMGESERSNSEASAAAVDVSESVAVFGKAVQGMGAIVESVAAAAGRARAEGCDADDSGGAGGSEGIDGPQVPPQLPPPQQQQCEDLHERDSRHDQPHDPQEQQQQQQQQQEQQEQQQEKQQHHRSQQEQQQQQQQQQQSAKPVVVVRRNEDPINDYSDAAPGMYAVFWPLFPLGRGLLAGKAMKDTKFRHLIQYFDTRFAKRLDFLFHCGDVKRRHDANLGVSATVKSKQSDFAAFTELINSVEFKDLLDEARKKPDSTAATALMRKVLPIVSLAGSRVRWGADEKRNLFTTFLNMRRAEGAASVMYNYAPDDVHDILAHRYSFPFTGYGTFPEAPPPEYFEAFVGTTSDARVVDHDEAPGGVFRLDERSLQKNAAANPVAMAQSFDVKNRAHITHLMGLSDNDKVDKPARGRNSSGGSGEARAAGLHGLPVATGTATETNQRQAPHTHGMFYGGLTPALLRDVADHKELRDAACEAAATQFTTSVPLECKAAGFRRRRPGVDLRLFRSPFVKFIRVYFSFIYLFFCFAHITIAFCY